MRNACWRVPPPTRRCTRVSGDRPRVAPGSSAHAEMHPRRSPTVTPTRWFLRPRGDAPDAGLEPVDAIEVPPPTRRCTRAEQDACSVSQGSSAHAEMHPTRGEVARGGGRFLRPRGDAPRARRRAPSRGPVPPPTRRCTVGLRRLRRRGRGSSAHAEMHPACRRTRRRSRWFLRPRGDAPWWVTGGSALTWVPPPTRRCTPPR